MIVSRTLFHAEWMTREQARLVYALLRLSDRYRALCDWRAELQAWHRGRMQGARPVLADCARDPRVPPPDTRSRSDFGEEDEALGALWGRFGDVYRRPFAAVWRDLTRRRRATEAFRVRREEGKEAAAARFREHGEAAYPPAVPAPPLRAGYPVVLERLLDLARGDAARGEPLDAVAWLEAELSRYLDWSREAERWGHPELVAIDPQGHPRKAVLQALREHLDTFAPDRSDRKGKTLGDVARGLRVYRLRSMGRTVRRLAEEHPELSLPEDEKAAQAAVRRGRALVVSLVASLESGRIPPPLAPLT